MAFPETPLDSRVELQVGGEWIDLTGAGHVYTRDPITITRGRADEGSRVDTSKCSLTINNRDGRYSPRNPISPYFGLIGRNSPLRVSVPGPESYLELTGVIGDHASTAATGITGDLDVRIEASADWYALDDHMLIGQWDSEVVGGQVWLLRLSGGILHFAWSPDGTNGSSFAVRLRLPDELPERAALRATLDVDDGAGNQVTTMYWAPSIAGPWEQFDAATFAGVTSIYDGTQPLRIAQGYVNGSGVTRLPIEGRVWAAEVYDGIDGTIVADPDFTAQTPGAGSFTDDTGNTWTIDGDARISDRAYRFHGEVSAWPQKWAISGADVWVPIEAAGIMRRLGQGQKALQSTLHRRIPSADGLLAYWPMEEGSEASQAYSPVTGVSPLHVAGLDFSSEDSLAGSLPLPTVQDFSVIRAQISPSTTVGWHVELVYKLDELPATESTFFRVRVIGSAVAACLVEVGNGRITLSTFDEDHNQLSTVSNADSGAISHFLGAWNRLQIFSSTDDSTAGQIHISVAWRDVVDNTWHYNFVSQGSTTMGAVLGVEGAWSTDLRGLAVGHLGIFDVPGVDGGSFSRPAVTIYDDADTGFAGETACFRMRRVAGEEGTPLWIGGGIATSTQVGPQLPAELLELLGDAADADGGGLYEHRDRLALRYRPRSTVYNQTPTLALTYGTAGEVAPPLEPVDDDQGTRNDRTVKRENGSSARAVLGEGPLSVQPPPDGVGITADSVTLNVARDSQLPDIASWRLHLGTVDEARYPTVHLRLHKAPHLIPGVLGLDLRDRITIADPPAWLPPDTIDLLAEGWTETLGIYTWDIELNCSPASPWSVGAIPPTQALTEDFEDDVLAVTITDGGDAPWARDNTEAYTGTWSLRSGTILGDQTSEASITVPDRAVSLSLAYKVSSEDFDWFRIYADDTLVLDASGDVGWTTATIPLGGVTAVRLVYIKDLSVDVGEDAAWVDQLVFAVVDADEEWDRADTAGSELVAAVTASATELAVLTTSGPEWVTSNGPGINLPDEIPLDLRVGGEVVTVTACAPYTWDAFDRTENATWGTSSSGHVWLAIGGAASDYTVAGGVGVITVDGSPTNLRQQIIDGETLGDVEMLCSITPDQLATGGAFLPGVIARSTDTDHYWLDLVLGADGSVGIEVRHLVTVLGATVTTDYTYVAGTTLWLRMSVVGERVRGRVWPDGGPEPAVWQVDRTVTSGTSPAGEVGICLASLATNAAPQFAHGAFEIVTPQVMTVARSVNGIEKAQTAGADVRLATPMITAL